jgi:hypothetical protein
MAAAWQATHVHIQQLETSLVVVSIPMAVLPIHQIQGVLHLVDILRCTRIQRLLNDRLLRTRLASKGLLQSRISSQARINLYQPMGSCQQADKGIIELIHWRMFDSLLPNLHLSADRAKQIKLTQLHSYGGQRSRRAKMVRRRCDRLVHGDTPSNECFLDSSLAMEYRPSFRKLFRACHLVVNLGET